MKSELDKQVKRIIKLKLGNTKAGHKARLGIAYIMGMSAERKAAEKARS